MTLEQTVLNDLRGLARPWQDLFERVAGLDLGPATTAADLRVPGRVNRTQPGFADFDPAGRAGIEPGDPAASYIYHALASPMVKPDGATPDQYPDVAMLDRLEDYILSLAPLPAASIPHNAVIAVMAYEYRPGPATTHRRQADFVYSRTGVGRVGEAPAQWDGPNRCWRNIDPATGTFAVMPARFAAFVAVPRRRSPTGISVLGEAPDDAEDERVFLLPIRKLFTGEGCVSGANLAVSFSEFHRREKLRRVFTEGGLPAPPGLDAPPYLRDSTQAEKIAVLEQAGSSLLVSSKPEALVRFAKLPNGQLATFRVPPRRQVPLIKFPLNRDNKSPSTFMIITGGLLTAGLEVFLQSFADVQLRPRNAPEFLNMRHKVTGGPGNQVVEDLGETLDDDAFLPDLDAGGYDAALFEDSIADGCIIAGVQGLPVPLVVKPAFSVLGAPKFFPYADQVDLLDWVNEFPSHNRQDQFKEGGPKPLHLGRFPPNLTLFRPGTTNPAFTADDQDAVAIVGVPYAEAAGATHSVRPQHRTTTYLADGCSDVFAPGWDVTFAEEDGVRFYATFGLGAPFPEDVKLCAAANAFWPAASPDAARTFNHGPTAIPMLDPELGYHESNPRHAGDPTFGWDGEQGPFIQDDRVNYANIVRSDYVSNALRAPGIRGAQFEEVDSQELIDRMEALRLCIQNLPESSAEVDYTKLWLIHAEKLDQAPGHAVQIEGPCYRYEFVIPTGAPRPYGPDPKRQTIGFSRRYVCYAAKGGMAWATSENEAFVFAGNPSAK